MNSLRLWVPAAFVSFLLISSPIFAGEPISVERQY